MKGTIDSLNGSLARIESEEGLFFTLPLSLLPGGAGEGDVLDFKADLDGQVSRLEIRLSRSESEEARTRIAGKLQKLRGGEDS
jgi:hypothetical protein